MPTPYSLSDLTIQLNQADNIAIARQLIPAQSQFQSAQGVLNCAQDIPAGHKIALQALQPGEAVIRYGYPIGRAVQPIQPGDWVHTHNVCLPTKERDLTYTLWQGTSALPAQPGATFMGYRRASGEVGTRNYLAVISTVSCSAQTALAIAAHFTAQRLAEFPNVDGVVAITHHTGCSIPPDGLAFTYLQRSLFNLIRHPNIGGVVFVTLGCEVMQAEECMHQASLAPQSLASAMPGGCPVISIQELGGIYAAVKAGIAAVEALLPGANAVMRAPQPASALRIALQCGGSDGWSGVTANPLLGMAVDELVALGGTAVLAETPEIYGAEQLLLSRVKNPEAAQKLIRQIRRWEQEARLLGFSLDNNPTPGNKAGGLTTIFEKSLGAVAKGGSSPLAAVYDYGEWISEPGLVFMDTPGNDPVSITGELAGGCNLIAFTTGRGSVFGSSLAPTIKIASNTALYQRMADDMDFNAGSMLEGLPAQQACRQLVDLLLKTASGAPSRSEAHGFRHAEFVPWQPGAVL